MSIGEEMLEQLLDIVEGGEVIFYDSVASAIRFIQERGKAYVKNPAKATILTIAGTKDDAYYWFAREGEEAIIPKARKDEDARDGIL
jgi:Fanconi anemia group M protein